jgi:hypothetical protein
MNPELLSLPWAVQVALASGYAAYILAYTGLREHHRALDTTFTALVFSLVATAVIAIMRDSFAPIVTGASAFAASVAVGLVWRKWGRPALRWSIRKPDLSWSDDAPSALASLTSNNQYLVSQVAVLLDDGTWPRCDETGRFNDAPFGPCLFGPQGDVALYLTHEEPAGSSEKVLSTVRDAYWGDRITYVPAGRIRQITIRHQRIR